jgi:predicted nucleic acid-binding protein
MTAVGYLDASAIVKLVVNEAESDAILRWYIESDRIVTNRVGVVETRRAVERREHDPGRLAAVIGRLDVIELDAQIGGRAAELRPDQLRTLDAIHIATALALPEVDAFITYDDRQAEAARLVGLPVIRPA